MNSQTLSNTRNSMDKMFLSFDITFQPRFLQFYLFNEHIYLYLHAFNSDWKQILRFNTLLFNKPEIYRTGEGAINSMLQNHMKYSVFNGTIFKFYFDLLIEISSSYFLNISLDFPERIVIFGICFKCTKNKLLNPLNFLENRFSWDKISLFRLYLIIWVDFFI